MTTPKPRPTIAYGETHSYPVLPLRDIVVFPHNIVPLFVGREKSIRALEAFDQHFHGAVGQFQKLQHARERAGLVDRIGGGIIIRRIPVSYTHLTLPTN